MSGAAYHERGGLHALRTGSAFRTVSELSRPPVAQDLDHLRPINAGTRQGTQPYTSVLSASSSAQSRLSPNLQQHAIPLRQDQGNLELPAAEKVARDELLQDAVFPDWKDDAAEDTLESPEEMQKKDPLGTQIWKLYSRTKTRLPNQERMENLTWRMMAMNLKRREREQRQAL